MFNNEDAKKKLLVRILRSDGETLSGYLVLPMMADLSRAMNNDTKFLEFQDLAGSMRFIAKASIMEMQTEELRSARLDVPEQSDAFEPYRELGLTKTASLADVRKAYLGITKQYHPDQFSSLDLPSEVVRYLSAKFSHANTAYNLIKSMTAKSAA